MKDYLKRVLVFAIAIAVCLMNVESVLMLANPDEAVFAEDAREDALAEPSAETDETVDPDSEDGASDIADLADGDAAADLDTVTAEEDTENGTVEADADNVDEEVSAETATDEPVTTAEADEEVTEEMASNDEGVNGEAVAVSTPTIETDAETPLVKRVLTKFKGGVRELVSRRLAAPATNWYEDYEYETSGSVITLKKYKGDAETLVVPATATIGGVDYTVAIKSVSATEYCIWSGDSAHLKSLTISAGVQLPENCTNLFYPLGSLTTLNISGVSTSHVTNMRAMFANCTSLTSLDLSGFDTSSVTDTESMFGSCSSLVSLDVSNFNTSNVTTMYQMFAYCESLEALDLSHFDTKNVTTMNSMFEHCSSLETLNVTNFNTGNVTNMNCMFDLCSSLTSLDVTSFNTSQTTNMRQMFYGCSGLTELDVTHFDTTNAGSVYCMFGNCTGLTELDLSSFDLANATTDTSSNNMAFNNLRLKKIKTPLHCKGYEPLAAEYTVLGSDPLITNQKTLPQNADVSYTLVLTTIEVTGVTLNKSLLTLPIGNAETLVATVQPIDATNQNVTWESDAPTTATVDANGKVTAVAVGNATITVTTEDGNHTATCAVTVVPAAIAATGVSLNKNTLSLTRGNTETLIATVLPTDAANKNVTWSSDNPAIATVDANGKVTAVAAGNATITVTTEDGNHKATCVVTVTTPATPTPTPTPTPSRTPTPTPSTTPSYTLTVVDGRQSVNGTKGTISASVSKLNGNRFLIVSDTSGTTLRPLIASGGLTYSAICFYDITLADSRTGGNKDTNFGTCTITMPVPSGMDIANGTLRVVSVQNGNLDTNFTSAVKAMTDGTQYISFTTTHFSEYAFLYTAANSATNTDGTTVVNTDDDEDMDSDDEYVSSDDDEDDAEYDDGADDDEDETEEHTAKKMPTASVETGVESTSTARHILDNIPKTGGFAAVAEESPVRAYLLLLATVLFIAGVLTLLFSGVSSVIKRRKRK